jgi:hypothetical protein
MVSKPACLAFELFKTSESIAFSQFAESTLEVRQYDGWLHVHRIYNLLSRMRRQFSPWISIRTRNQRIYTITRWEKIGFVHPTPHEAIRASEPWKKLLQPPGERLPLSKLRASLPGPFTRSELERVAQVSRSSANRMLCQLKKRGHIRASGAGKNTDYAFLEPGHRIKVPITPAHS